MAGVPFHRNFSKIGLGAQHAQYISFLELLDIPTIGNKSQNIKLFYELVSQPHLEYIESLMLGSGGKLFYVSNGVLKDIAKLKKDYPVFRWLDLEIPSKGKYVKIINGNKIKEIYHFSSSQIHGQVSDIALEINNWLEKTC